MFLCNQFVQLQHEIYKRDSNKAVKNAYQNGDIKFDINPAKSALLVIDMQDELVK